MNIVFKPNAEDTLRDIVEFVDDMNLSGAGERWAVKLVEFVQKYADLKSVKKFPLCNNESLAFAGLSCIIYKGWVIAFKIENKNLVIYQIVKGELLY
ncbi:MAG: hypothetical protein KA149_08905 [Chitinophagales bacterium]|jgi:hypothetical protein|nr:hypothetical protein [Chitinophagales bacterium]